MVFYPFQKQSQLSKTNMTWYNMLSKKIYKSAISVKYYLLNCSKIWTAFLTMT